MSVNVPLLRKVVEWVEEQEKLAEGREWLQEEWISNPETERVENADRWCETAYCVAGKVAVIEGWEPLKEEIEGCTYYSVYVQRDGERRPVANVAIDALGIDEGTSLFAADNTAADIRRIAENIAGEQL